MSSLACRLPVAVEARPERELAALVTRCEETARNSSHVQRGLRYENDVADLLLLAHRLFRENQALTENVTAVQTRCTEQLVELRALRPLTGLADGLRAARAKHPGGSDLRSLVEEVGEVASAIRRESADRIREELLDVAVVAMRLRAGEWFEGMTL